MISPKAYLKKYENGYPEQSEHIQSLSKKELREKIGKGSFFKDMLINYAGRYSSGLKALEEKAEPEKSSETVAHFTCRNGHLILDFLLYNGSSMKFGFLNSEIKHIAIIQKVEEIGTRETSGLVAGLIGSALMGSFGGKVGRELGKRTVTEVSSKERINLLAIHTEVDNIENVITILFKYKKLSDIQYFFNKSFEKKVVHIQGGS